MNKTKSNQSKQSKQGVNFDWCPIMFANETPLIPLASIDFECLIYYFFVQLSLIDIAWFWINKKIMFPWVFTFPSTSLRCLRQTLITFQFEELGFCFSIPIGILCVCTEHRYNSILTTFTDIYNEPQSVFVTFYIHAVQESH